MLHLPRANPLQSCQFDCLEHTLAKTSLISQLKMNHTNIIQYKCPICNKDTIIHILQLVSVLDWFMIFNFNFPATLFKLFYTQTSTWDSRHYSRMLYLLQCYWNTFSCPWSPWEISGLIRHVNEFREIPIKPCSHWLIKSIVMMCHYLTLN